MVDSSDSRLHPDFPNVVRVVVEQPRGARTRIRYEPEKDAFVATETPSVFLEHSFPGVYGWVHGLGRPPGSHCDILVLTDLPFQPGEMLDSWVCGALLRPDFDHKILGVDAAYAGSLEECDLAAIPRHLRLSAAALYPPHEIGGHWVGATEAKKLLEAIRTRAFIPNAD